MLSIRGARAYVNSQLTGLRKGWDTPFAFELPADLARHGGSTVAVRVLGSAPKGGISRPVNLCRARKAVKQSCTAATSRRRDVRVQTTFRHSCLDVR